MAAYKPVNRVADYASDYVSEGKDVLAEYPMSSVMVAFGLGFATGLALVALLSDGHSRHETSAHRVGQHLLDAMSSVLPDTLARSFRT